jgi:hypothetical protein
LLRIGTNHGRVLVNRIMKFHVREGRKGEFIDQLSD